MLSLPRSLAVFLVGLLCFSFIPSTASAAELAAASNGLLPMPGTGIGRKFKTSWQTFYSDKFDGDPSLIEFNTGCTGQAQVWGQEEGYGSQNVNWTIKFADVQCWTARPLTHPGAPMWPDGPWEVTLQAQGVTPLGDPCTTQAEPIEVGDLDGSVRWAKWFFKGEIGPATGAYVQCQFTRWMIVGKQDSFPMDRSFQLAGDLDNLDLPTVPEVAEPEVPTDGTCTFGKPTTISVAWGWIGTPGPSGARLVKPTVNSTTGFTGSWNVAAVVKHKTTNAITHVAIQYTGRTGQTQLVPGSSAGVIGSGDNWTLVGVQVTSSAGPNDQLAPGANAAVAGSNYGRGVTNPPLCRFWYGPKIYDDGAPGGHDVPWGVHGEEPPDPDAYVEPIIDEPVPTAPILPPECSFTLTDPSTWLSGGMCAVVGLLGAILNLIEQLVGAILGLPMALLEAIGALFVPDLARLSATASGLKDSFAESSPGQYFTAAGSVYSAFSPSTGSCAGPTIGINYANVNVDMKPMNACGGTGATVATVSRAIISLSVLIGTFFALLRIIGSSIGYNLNGLGGRGDD